MKLKDAALSVMQRDDLKVVVQDYEIEGVDLRSREDMADALRAAKRVRVDALLEYLDEQQVKEVCELTGVSSTGRRRALIERLIEARQERLASRNRSGQEARADDEDEAPPSPPNDEQRSQRIEAPRETTVPGLTITKVDLIYIDPPFGTGADFSFKVLVGDDDDPLPGKEPSVVEEKAYRDTWGRGLDSYLSMIEPRLRLLRDLLADTGSIFIHADVHVGPYLKLLMDDIFGKENFQNEIVWYYYNKLHGAKKRCIPKAFDQILYYVKNGEARYTYHTLAEPRDEPVKKLKYSFIDGKIVNDKDENGKTVTYLSTERQIDNVWRIRCLQPANKAEWVHYATQKPVDLIERVLALASNPGDLVLDCFCGSGSSLVAAERNDRRWIGCDLGRFAIHTTRKRLLDIPECKTFEILNLGQYERKYWQGVTFGDERPTVPGQAAVAAYVKFILDLYLAQPLPGTHIHGRKGGALVHVGAVDAPVTISEINAALAEAAQLDQKELHVLGWEWEMGLHDPLVQQARQSHGVRLRLLNIPREVMERQAVDRGDVRFFDLAHLEAKVFPAKGSRRRVKIQLADFVIPDTDLILEEVRSKIRKWSDYIDYWAVDWDFQHDTFMNQWQAYRTRKNRKLELESAEHEFDRPGKYKILVKVVDIFGNDTSQILIWEAR
jgi:adenine-specific DNA-methyltransferase